MELHGIQKYFKGCIVSGEMRMRNPESRIFDYAIGYIQCSPQECILVDNSVQNLNAAQNAGINTVLFNRDHEAYAGNVVNNFQELDSILKKYSLFGMMHLLKASYNCTYKLV